MVKKYRDNAVRYTYINPKYTVLRILQSQMPEPVNNFELHIDIDEPLTAAEILARKSGLSKQKIKQVMQKGAVWLTQGKQTKRLRRAGKVLTVGETLHCYYDENILHREPPQAVLVADEGDFSIWYKPYGMLSQGSKWGDHTTIYRFAEQRLQPQRTAFIVHRLDRAATGLIILAHKKETAAAFARMFQQHEIEKHYRVIVHGSFPASRQHINEDIDGKPASSYASRIDYDEETDRSLLEVRIETGRKHQVRKHLAAIGFPVLGDRLYGEKGDSEDLQLCACFLEFTSPIDGETRQYRLAEQLLPRL